MARKLGPVLSGRSRALILLTAIAFAVGVSTFWQSTPQDEKSAWPAFDLQGHRGARGLMPENTLPAMEAALAIGVATLELDLVMSKDGELLVHHDPALDPERTRDAHGHWIEEPSALSTFTLDEIAAFDVGCARPGGKVAERFSQQACLTGVRIPALRDLLSVAEARSGGRVRYNIEIKSSPLEPTGPDPKAAAKALAALLREFDLAERAVVQAFDWRALEALQAEAPEIGTAYLTVEQSWFDNLERGKPGVSPWTAGLDFDEGPISVPEAVARKGGVLWSPYYRDLRAADVAEAHRLGLRVVPWTVNEPEAMRLLFSMQVDGIITDYPDRLRAEMEKAGLPLPASFPDTQKK